MTVFSETDFDGFKNVGEGSKMQDKGSIGQFGRGSQTMFHFTDFPMILSGDYILILEYDVCYFDCYHRLLTASF